MSVVDPDQTAEHDESYFASFTDLLVGVLFIFILLLMIFAHNFNQTVSEVTGIKESRDKVLTEIKKSLDEQGVEVSIDLEQGVLRLPDSILFGVNESRLNSRGIEAVNKLASVLKKYLPCLATLKGITKEQNEVCENLNLQRRDALESVLIEGHTDFRGSRERNWQLSMERAVSVFRQLTVASPELDDRVVTVYVNDMGGRKEVPVLAISGYEARRPIEVGNEIESLRKNRRIDIRFIMKSPTPRDVQQISKDIGD
jgi:chemotaxis protein MotB